MNSRNEINRLKKNLYLKDYSTIQTNDNNLKHKTIDHVNDELLKTINNFANKYHIRFKSSHNNINDYNDKIKYKNKENFKSKQKAIIESLQKTEKKNHKHIKDKPITSSFLNTFNNKNKNFKNYYAENIINSLKRLKTHLNKV